MREIVVMWLNHRRYNYGVLTPFDFKFFSCIIDHYRQRVIKIDSTQVVMSSEEIDKVDGLAEKLIREFNIIVYIEPMDRTIITNSGILTGRKIIKYE